MFYGCACALGLEIVGFDHSFRRLIYLSIVDPGLRHLMTIWGIIRDEVSPVAQFVDEAVWILEDHGSLSLKYAYLAISGFRNHDRVPWVDLIWFKGCIKKKKNIP